ncbi:oxidized purine nucleoside triphosphate hydrolase-like [Ptychodera flava]|uniref:oxidized purine nucleoside triphosphate hydrolase-like n=1 Tax=Ptychodera flava TaxID=63121 RepID=UPI003969C198
MESPNHIIKKKLLTIVYIVKNEQILLGMKKRGFGVGNWNGFGGKVQAGESIEEAARRELQEESSLVVDSLQKVGVVDQEFVGDPVILEIHIYKADSYHGEPTESEEMKPQWFNVDEIPFDKMWLDDQYWFPYMLKGSCFYAYYLFEGFHKILKEKLLEVTSEEVRSHLEKWRR